MTLKVVSYALFAHAAGGSWKSDGTPGRIEGYLRYLPAIIRAHHVLWPSWTLVLHHDRELARHRYFPALRRMHDRGLICLVDCGDAGDVGYAPMWRFRPVFRDQFRDSIVLCHDIDSFPSWTMRCCAEEFVNTSTATAAVVHGCESHNTAMAGLFLLRAPRFRELVGADTFDVFMAQKSTLWNWYGADEHYLRDAIWPKLEHEAMLIRIGNPNPSLINAPDVRREITAVPDDVAVIWTTIGNSFSPYPGAAGFDIESAMDRFDQCRGWYAALESIDACEQGIATGREISRL